MLRALLVKEYEIKDLGALRYFLGMEAARLSKGILVSQWKYVLDLLMEISMLGFKLAETPIKVNGKLGMKEDSLLVEKIRYERLVGKLIYLSHTCPDIAFLVSIVSF